ncbi:hypothetical protein RN001_012344 [Aquatica leii]|uniref:Leucine-rich repeat-containing protein 27 n=1 Tax=Aquatica leii TaxID=1421715 RepID=A0AAN7P3Q1_9COLE|nr:hypothetical protein RN001_012344 [Aquatica leii]
MSLMDVISDNANQKLKKIPENILQMTNLKMLYLEENEIEELPNDFFINLSKLTWLDLRKNKLSTLPSNVAHHEHLETILLQYNRIEYLPVELGVVPKLKVLQISGNPLVYPPQDVIIQGILTVCSFLKEEYMKLQQQKTDIELINEVSPDSCSVVTKDDDKQNLEPLPKTNEKDAFVPIIVQNLSNNADKNAVASLPSGLFKRTHKITRGCSKISLRSHSSWNNKKKNDRIQENSLKDVWLKQKNLKALSKWRLKKKLESPKNINLDDLPPPPYDIDPECKKMMSRRNLTEDLDTMIEKSKNQKKKSKVKKVNIQELIDEVVSQMKYLQTQVSRRTKSPRTEQEIAGKEIESIIKLHKKIVDLQQKNNNL